MRVLITGVRSFSGKHLLARLSADSRVDWIGGLDLDDRGPDGLAYWSVDIRSAEDLARAVTAAAPNVVIHLAGVARGDAEDCDSVNHGGLRNLLRAVCRCATVPRIVAISSAAVYGLTSPDESPVKETCPLRPVSPYGASKGAAELSALAAHRRGEVPVVVLRPFNLVGPGLSPGFAPSDFLERAKGLAGLPEPRQIRVGNLEPRRDFVDVRDVVRAYAEMAFADGVVGGVFNVGSGRPRAIREVLTLALEAVGVDAEILVDPKLVRKVEVAEQIADIGAIELAIGWTPGIPLDRSIRDMAQS